MQTGAPVEESRKKIWLVDSKVVENPYISLSLPLNFFKSIKICFFLLFFVCLL